MKGAKTPLPVSFQRGLSAYNQGAFYDAHEHFETAWRQTPGDAREFFRAFLHLSGGFFRLTQDRPEAARKFFVHAKKWFSGVPDHHHGFDVVHLLLFLEQLINLIDQSVPADEILANQFQPIQPLERRSR
jgi:predicted metal-dependent hydrolase